MDKINKEDFLKKYAESESDFDEEQIIKDFEGLTEEDQKQVSKIIFGMFKDISKDQNK